MKCADQPRKKMFLTSEPMGVEFEGGGKFPIFSARNHMKCAHLHRKIMLLAPSIWELGLGVK